VTPWQLVIMAKSPVAGVVKTRLCPPLLPEEAARLAAASIEDTTRAGLASSASRCVLALAGPVGAWVPPGVVVMGQGSGDLGARLGRAMADAWAAAPVPMLVVGMDTPQLTPTLLDAVAETMLGAGSDVVLGPAHDGGYWAVGSRQPVPGLFATVPMSTDETYERQCRRVRSLGLRVRSVAAVRDVDDFADAVVVAGDAPGTRFARELRALAGPMLARTPPRGGALSVHLQT
jgi:uncharacterized protein